MNLWGCSTKALEIISWGVLNLGKFLGETFWNVMVIKVGKYQYCIFMILFTYLACCKQYWFGLCTDSIPGALYILFNVASVAWLLMLKILKDLAGLFVFRYCFCSIRLTLSLPQKAVLVFNSDSPLIICDLYSCQFEII